MKILIVDDDKRIAELLTLYLKKEGYNTLEVYDGREAIKEFPVFAPHLVLLDLMLPGADGYEVCREIRRMSNVPVIFLSAKGDTFDKVLGLELGADDYIVKPFEPKEIVARVKAVLRRYDQKPSSENKIVYPNLSIDTENLTVIYHEKQLELPRQEYELLVYLAKHPGKPFSRDQLLNACWGFDYYGDTRTVDVHVKRLREKMKGDDTFEIKTVWGIGYKFEV